MAGRPWRACSEAERRPRARHIALAIEACRDGERREPTLPIRLDIAATSEVEHARACRRPVTPLGSVDRAPPRRRAHPVGGRRCRNRLRRGCSHEVRRRVRSVRAMQLMVVGLRGRSVRTPRWPRCLRTGRRWFAPWTDLSAMSCPVPRCPRTGPRCPRTPLGGDNLANPHQALRGTQVESPRAAANARAVERTIFLRRSAAEVRPRSKEIRKAIGVCNWDRVEAGWRCPRWPSWRRKSIRSFDHAVSGRARCSRRERWSVAESMGAAQQIRSHTTDTFLDGLEKRGPPGGSFAHRSMSAPGA